MQDIGGFVKIFIVGCTQRHTLDKFNLLSGFQY